MTSARWCIIVLTLTTAVADTDIIYAYLMQADTGNARGDVALGTLLAEKMVCRVT